MDQEGRECGSKGREVDKTREEGGENDEGGGLEKQCE